MFDLPDIALADSPEAAVLDALAVGWSVIVARDARPIGFRLALRPLPGSAPPPTAAVLERVLAVFTEEGTAGFPHGLVLLAPQGFELDRELLRLSPPRNVLLEVPQAMLADDAATRLLYEVQRHGVRLALRASAGWAPPREKLALFQYVLGAVGAPPHSPEPALIATGAVTRAQAEAAFKQGANAVLGWPAGPAAPGSRLQPQQRAVLDLIRMVQADAELRDIERAFKGEPLLAYLLLTLANSPAFARGSPVGSLSQAIGLLGYARLLKWLVLLLAIASKGGRALPAIYAAVARGFTMEGLAAAAGLPLRARDESFVVGVFSLLDHVTGHPLPDLITAQHVPGAIGAALLDGDGPYAPYLALAADSDGLGNAPAVPRPAIAPAAALRAQLHALASTDALQGVI